MDELELYNYFDTWHNEDIENKCCSFTYWHFLYDMLMQDRIDEECNLYKQLYERSFELLEYKNEERITNKLIAELLEIDELQEYAEDFIFGHE